MKNEDDLNHDVLRMQSVNEVLNNTEYQKAFMMIKAHLMTQFESLGYKQQDDMIEIHRKIQALNWVQDELQGVMETGKMSHQTLLDRIKNKAGF